MAVTDALMQIFHSCHVILEHYGFFMVYFGVSLANLFRIMHFSRKKRGVTTAIKSHAQCLNSFLKKKKSKTSIWRDVKNRIKIFISRSLFLTKKMSFLSFLHFQFAYEEKKYAQIQECNLPATYSKFNLWPECLSDYKTALQMRMFYFRFWAW